MELRRKGGGDGRSRACRGLAARSIALVGRADACCRVRSVVAAAGFAGSSCDHEGFVGSRGMRRTWPILCALDR
jgi:hypothetical protein